MDYTYVEEKNGDVILYDVKNFDLAQTLDCGQAFRWKESAPGEFTGIAHGRRLNVKLTNGEFRLCDVSLAEFENLWKNYFDFGRNYGELKTTLAKNQHLRAAMEFSPGLRLMQQDVWEVTISFILSQNSNIPRIKKMVESLCECFGDKLPCGGYAFPSPGQLATLCESDLAPIKCGYRASYVLDAARRAAKTKLSELNTLCTDEIRSSLLEICGVGPKVADCILLYGFYRTECYPTDVWIKRVMSVFFPEGFPPEIEEYVGIAQQFLFRYARENLPRKFAHSKE